MTAESAKPSSLKAVLERMRTWTAQRSPRERALAAVVAFAAAMTVCSELYAVALQARAESAAAALQRAQLVDVGGTTLSTRRDALADAAARAARSASIGGETIHIARARAQAEVESAARVAGVADVTVSLGARPETSGPVETILLDVDGAYTTASFAAFLEALSRSEASLAPRTVDAIAGRESGRFRMTVEVYALTPGDAS